MNVHAGQLDGLPLQQRFYADRAQKLTDDQRAARELLAGPQTHTCLVGGSRSGKTTLLVRAIVTRALRAPDSRHLITRFRANALRASVWLDTLPKVMRLWFPGVQLTPHRMDGFEELSNGSQIWFGGLDEADRVEKILGQEYATILANEVSQIPYSSIVTLRTRLAQPGTGLRLRAYYDLNPTSTLHWSNVEFGLKLDPISRRSLPDPDNFQRMFLNPDGNADNLDPTYLSSLRNMPEQFRRRFYEGAYVLDVDGALWTADLLELCRDEPVDCRDQIATQRLRRISVAVDPSGAQAKDDKRSDDIGINVAAKLDDGKSAIVLEDATMKGSPKEWGMAAVAAYKRWDADIVVAEANFGGEMVRSTIQAVDSRVPVKLVKASRGKAARAEPVSALYEAKRVRHAGQFPHLEEQMCYFTTSGYVGSRSPDRADALVWNMHELLLGEQSTYTLAHVS